MENNVNVAILIYPGVEVIDMNGPIDVFIKTNRYNNNKYRVFTVAESAGVIESEHSAVRIIPEYTLSNCPKPDILVIPGQIMPEGSPEPYGSGSDELVTWIKKQAQSEGATIMSVCVGIYFLVKTGLLNTKKATTHWAALEDIQKQYPDIDFIKNVRFVADGNIVSTGGVTSGIDGALYLVDQIDGAEIAQQVADIMVYNREAPLPPNTILP
ncbi:DJ-1/PfpI family protein [Flavobacterium humi]|uniref:DJ-1/PfpI family protein n=1 Tax=Flavobacterium humi TaxID=2562683 RepID=A0A4Z0LCX4_9FLAO|nr:DJ-1/PfpI family protein [Flavobacterium humi]TGD59740.1 DJ-1/PfpI family protein [Flavobacterium humi]